MKSLRLTCLGLAASTMTSISWGTESPAIQPIADLSGEIIDGANFGNTLKPGLSFQLRLSTASHKGTYEIWLGDPSNPEANYCGAISGRPPLISGISLKQQGSGVALSEAAKNRSFRCAADAASYRKAHWASMHLNDRNQSAEWVKATFIADQYQRTAFEGRLAISDFRIAHPKQGNPDITFFKFTFRLLTVPDPLYSKDDIGAPATVEGHDNPLVYQPEKTIEISGYDSAKLLITLHRYKPPDDSNAYSEASAWSVWLAVGDRFRLLKRLDLTPTWGYLDNDSPVIFQWKDKHFIAFPIEQPGTGHIREDEIFALTPRNELQRVPFDDAPDGYKPQLAEGEGVWKGEQNTFDDNDLGFEFAIWKQGDPNCCPSAGNVKGKYGVVGGDTFDAEYGFWPDLRIVPTSYKREPPN